MTNMIADQKATVGKEAMHVASAAKRRNRVCCVAYEEDRVRCVATIRAFELVAGFDFPCCTTHQKHGPVGAKVRRKGVHDIPVCFEFVSSEMSLINAVAA